MTTPYIIGISGGSGSGKTTFAKRIFELLGSENCAILGQDSYYIDQSHRFDKDGGAVNFDHPNALEFSLMAKHLENLKKGLSVDVPIYDFSTHKRLEEVDYFSPKPFVLVDGILILSQENVRDQLDESIFIDVPEDTRFERRLNRDVKERGRTPLGVFKQFHNQVKPMHDQFVGPSKVFATKIVTMESFIFDLNIFVEYLRKKLV